MIPTLGGVFGVDVLSRYGGRLLSYGEYSTNQFFIIFISVIFAGEAAAKFFGYTTNEDTRTDISLTGRLGLTKAQSAANYVFWIRSRTPSVHEDPSKPGPAGDGDSNPLAIEVSNVDFAFPLRPNVLVIHGLDVTVSAGR